MEDPRALPDADAPPRPRRGAARCARPRHAPARHVPGHAAQPPARPVRPRHGRPVRVERAPHARRGRARRRLHRQQPGRRRTRQRPARRSRGRRTGRRSASSRRPMARAALAPASVRDDRHDGIARYAHSVDRQRRPSLPLGPRRKLPRCSAALLAILLAASAAWLAVDVHPGRDPRARRRHRPRRPPVRRDQGITAATDVALVLRRPLPRRHAAGGGKVRPGVAEMYVGKALLPAARTTDPAPRPSACASPERARSPWSASGDRRARRRRPVHRPRRAAARARRHRPARARARPPASPRRRRARHRRHRRDRDRPGRPRRSRRGAGRPSPSPGAGTRHPPRPSLPAAIIVAWTMLQAAIAAATPLSAFDGLVTWAFKAHALLVFGTPDSPPFDPALYPGPHPEYPILWPEIQATALRINGGYDDAVLRANAIACSAACCSAPMPCCRPGRRLVVAGVPGAVRRQPRRHRQRVGRQRRRDPRRPARDHAGRHAPRPHRRRRRRPAAARRAVRRRRGADEERGPARDGRDPRAAAIVTRRRAVLVPALAAAVVYLPWRAFRAAHDLTDPDFADQRVPPRDRLSEIPGIVATIAGRILAPSALGLATSSPWSSSPSHPAASARSRPSGPCSSAPA